MRGATECAKRFKLLLSGLRSSLGKVAPPAPADPITQMILGVLSRDTPESKAAEGLDRLRTMVVDYNELRVIPPIELAEVLHDFPDARLKCEDISRALNRIFLSEHGVTLERVEALPKREQAAFFEDVDGLDAYSRARTRLLGLNQHALPLDEAMWAFARQEEIVATKCGLAEAQQFLERQVKEGEALEVFALLRKQAWSVCGAAVKKGEVERILSIPPDRTARNMLQQVAAAAGRDLELVVDADDLEGLDLEEPATEAPEEEAKPAAKGKKKSRAAAAGGSETAAEKPARKSGKRAAVVASAAPVSEAEPKAATATKSSARRSGTRTRAVTKGAAAGAKSARSGSKKATKKPARKARSA